MIHWVGSIVSEGSPYSPRWSMCGPTIRTCNVGPTWTWELKKLRSNVQSKIRKTKYDYVVCLFCYLLARIWSVLVSTPFISQQWQTLIHTRIQLYNVTILRNWIWICCNNKSTRLYVVINLGYWFIIKRFKLYFIRSQNISKNESNKLDVFG
jgi:hypothetical protein